MEFDSNLLRGSVETIILHLLSERKMYGYEIIKEVNGRTEGAFAWKEGTLYPCLHRMEGDGAIASEWETAASGKQRKYYRLTRRGEALCREKTDEWQAFSAAMHALLCRPAGA